MSRPLLRLLPLLAVAALLLPSAAGGDNDPTPPAISFNLAGTRGANGWYTSNVTVSWTFGDPESGIKASSGCDTATVAADTAGARFTCAATNQADVGASVSVTVKRDATPPEVTAAAPDRAPDGNGWYTRPVVISFAGSDATAGIDSCSVLTYSGPDAQAASVSGTCRDKAGNTSASRGVAFSYDATPPDVTEPNPERPPDSADWYTRPVTFRFAGADAGSGVEACTPVTYGGPDSDAASVTGTCRDRAGNTSAPRSFPLKFDATAPAVRAVTVDAGDTTATLRWRSSPDAEFVELVRSPGRRGARETRLYRGRAQRFRDRALRNGVRYRYEVIAYDRARNAARRAVVAVPRGALLAPAEGARVSRPPLLAWSRVRRATYYNVQLYRGGKKVLTAWPARPRFRVRHGWRYAGRRQRLTPGRYRWYVWPGYGRPSQRRYGKLLGHSSFVVPR